MVALPVPFVEAVSVIHSFVLIAFHEQPTSVVSVTKLVVPPKPCMRVVGRSA